MSSRGFWIAAFALCPLTASASGPLHGHHAPVPITYCVYDLGGGIDATGQAIHVTGVDLNNRGQVVGSYSVGGITQAFVWDLHRGIRLLGWPAGQTVSSLEAINDAGIAVGNSSNPKTDTLAAFSWDALHGIRVVDPPLGRYIGLGDINRKGQMVGTWSNDRYSQQAFRSERNGDAIDLGTLGGSYSYAAAINDRGTVVGFSETLDGGYVGFMWTDAEGFHAMYETDIGFPNAVNNRNQAVGGAHDGQKAFFWSPSEGNIDLGTLAGNANMTAGAEAHDINDWSTVVGDSQNAELVSHAFIWRRQTGMKDLNAMIDDSSSLAPYIELRRAENINEFGWIMAIGNDTRLLVGSHTFVLVPRWNRFAPRCM